jgi:flagella basal body P-ring formation protein FlgA
MKPLLTHRCMLCGLALLAALPASAADVEVELRPRAVAQGAQVMLGDVAYVRGDELDAVVRLVRLPLGRAPRAGSQARLSRDNLQRWARSQLGSLASQANWTGADEVNISSVAQDGHQPAAQVTGRRSAPVVARGEWVTLLARQGGIELEGPAEALEDGQVGQPVRVRSAGSSGSIVARVVAPGRVEVRP